MVSSIVHCVYVAGISLYIQKIYEQHQDRLYRIMPLKFLIRTSDMSYPIVQGQYHHRHDPTRAPTSLLQQRYFTVQVNQDSSTSSSSEFYGCCNHEHYRIILVREMNFLRYCSDWDLYIAVNTTNHHNPSFQLLQLILVPYTLYRNECLAFNAWTHIGTCRASAIRLDVEAYVLKHFQGLSLYQLVLNPQRYSYPIEHTSFQVSDTHSIKTVTSTSSNYHWHIDVYMDSMVDESYASASMSAYLASSSSSSSSSSVLSSDRPNAPSIDAAHGYDLISTCDKENHIISSSNEVDKATATGDMGSLLPTPQRKKTRRKKPYRRNCK